MFVPWFPGPLANQFRQLEKDAKLSYAVTWFVGALSKHVFGPVPRADSPEMKESAALYESQLRQSIVGLLAEYRETICNRNLRQRMKRDVDIEAKSLEIFKGVLSTLGPLAGTAITFEP